MMRKLLVAGVIVLGLGGWAASAWAQGKPSNRRAVPVPAPAPVDSDDPGFYLAPMLSYGFFGEDSFEPGDEAGVLLAFGKPITDWLSLEVFAFHFNGVAIERTGRSGNIDVTGYGLSALLFPMPNIFPVFGIVGAGAGEYDFDQVSLAPGANIGDIDRQDADFIDLGFGFVYPLQGFGFDFTLRGEYRYRMSEVDAAAGGGEYKFRNHVVSLGLQIPLGAQPNAPPRLGGGESTQRPFYFAPMLSYGFFGEDSFEPGDEAGALLAFGKPITDWLSLEVFAFHFNGVPIERTGRSGNIDVTGYGLSALLFPMPNIFPVFGIVGAGAGEYDFDQVSLAPGANIGDIDRQDADFIDLGVGFAYPLQYFGFDFTLRGEYRYRMSDVDAAAGGGEYKFRNHIISLGLQIPLGGSPTTPRRPPRPVSTPEPLPL